MSNGGKTVKILCYMDDAVLNADTKDNLQGPLHKYVTKWKNLTW